MKSSRWRAAVLLVAVFFAAVADVRAQKERTYREIVAKYRAGEFDAAIKEIAALRSSALDDERRTFERTPLGTLQPAEAKAAIMLHTEAHFQSASGDLAFLPSPHLDRARRLARRVLERGDPPPPAILTNDQRRARLSVEPTASREFVRQWYLLLASHFQGKRQGSRSAHYLQEARFLFPDDPDILLASGSHHEMLTFIANGRLPIFNERGEIVREENVDLPKERGEASRYFRAALAANPALHEARLRLGRTLYVLGELAAAAEELEKTRSHATDDGVKYLATVFLALVEEDRGARSRAAQLYVEAMNAFPEAQASYVGVSELLYADGQPDKAAATMTMLLEHPAPRDWWWVYLMGQWWHFDARLTRLRERARE